MVPPIPTLIQCSTISVNTCRKYVFYSLTMTSMTQILFLLTVMFSVCMYIFMSECVLIYSHGINQILRTDAQHQRSRATGLQINCVCSCVSAVCERLGSAFLIYSPQMKLLLESMTRVESLQRLYWDSRHTHTHTLGTSQLCL